MPGARNPKQRGFTVRVTLAMNDRLEALADRAGANKITMASICLAAGINLLEASFQTARQNQLMTDLQEAGFGKT
jgi:predicted DNA-binding protein